MISFSGKNIPVVVAEIMNKDPMFVRQALISQELPIGIASKKEGNSKYDYYISPKLFYEFTGFYFDEDISEDKE